MLVTSKNSTAVISNLTQLTIELFDMTIHLPLHPKYAAAINPSLIYHYIREQICQLEDSSDINEHRAWGSGFSNLSHLIDGYEADFYSYLL